MGRMSQKEEHTGSTNHLDIFMLFLHLLSLTFSVGHNHKQKKNKIKQRAHKHNLIWKPHIQTVQLLE